MLKIRGEMLSLWRHQAIEEAIAAGISSKEVDWLLQEIAGLDSLSLRLESFKGQLIALSQPLSTLSQLWQRRLQERIPVQYLVGKSPWRHFSIRVSPDVLIPRPETEFLIDLACESLRGADAQIASSDWVDLGTGSGAIALGLAEILPEATIHAVDCSQAALNIARTNAACLNLDRRIQFHQGSWWSPLKSLQGQIGGMVSNPPYIPTALIPKLQPEVLHEPRLALDGGMDGLNYVRHLIESAPRYLRSGGIWLSELMAGQGNQVEQMLRQQGEYSKIQIYPDLAGIDRYALAYRL